jgi:hypothetical protein
LPPQAVPKAVAEKPGEGRNDPCPCGSGMHYKECHGSRASIQRVAARDTSRRIALCAMAFLAMLAIACVAIEAVYFFQNGPMAYLHGIQLVNTDHNPNRGRP